mmetsp:Transcript_56208/g.144714  ORF Transcript_56208/g.144714 Transcript_56208/m.144714 type:complete len:374 (+) Transcript_56208:278-1399(+)
MLAVHAAHLGLRRWDLRHTELAVHAATDEAHARLLDEEIGAAGHEQQRGPEDHDDEHVDERVRRYPVEHAQELANKEVVQVDAVRESAQEAGRAQRQGDDAALVGKADEDHSEDEGRSEVRVALIPTDIPQHLREDDDANGHAQRQLDEREEDPVRKRGRDSRQLPVQLVRGDAQGKAGRAPQHTSVEQAVVVYAAGVVCEVSRRDHDAVAHSGVQHEQDSRHLRLHVGEGQRHPELPRQGPGHQVRAAAFVHEEELRQDKGPVGAGPLVGPVIYEEVGHQHECHERPQARDTVAHYVPRRVDLRRVGVAVGQYEAGEDEEEVNAEVQGGRPLPASPQLPPELRQVPERDCQRTETSPCLQRLKIPSGLAHLG